MNRKNLLAILSLVTLTSFVLTGCAGETEEPQSSEQAASTEASKSAANKEAAKLIDDSKVDVPSATPNSNDIARKAIDNTKLAKRNSDGVERSGTTEVISRGLGRSPNEKDVAKVVEPQTNQKSDANDDDAAPSDVEKKTIDPSVHTKTTGAEQPSCMKTLAGWVVCPALEVQKTGVVR